MAKSIGAPEGNDNASKNKPWQAAILRALKRRSLVSQKEALDEAAEALVDKCIAGDVAALKEMGDRTDGKVTQPVDANVGGNIIVEIVKFSG